MSPKKDKKYPRDLSGLKFGMLVLRRVSGGKNSRWECLCHCGNTTVISRPDVFIAKSCGCEQYAWSHGMSRTITHKSWNMMRNRCLNPNADCYESYGGRGIKVCRRWNKFENFLADMGERPSMKFSLERINNNGNYEPSNCKWATSREQMRNTRRTIRIEIDGEEFCAKDAAKLRGINYQTFLGRIRFEKSEL